MHPARAFPFRQVPLLGDAWWHTPAPRGRTTRQEADGQVRTDEVEALLGELAERFAAIDPDLRRTMLPPRRTLELSVPDLGVRFHTTLEHGELLPLTEGPLDRPDVRVTTDSGDLAELADGRLRLSEAYATGRLRVEASMMDLLRLRVVM